MNVPIKVPDYVEVERSKFALFANAHGINLATGSDVHEYEYAVARFAWKAWLDRAAQARAQQALAHEEWREAVFDHAVSAFVSTEGSARDVIRRIIEVNVAIALDPAVSERAQALVDRGAALAGKPPTPALLSNPISH